MDFRNHRVLLPIFFFPLLFPLFEPYSQVLAPPPTFFFFPLPFPGMIGEKNNPPPPPPPQKKKKNIFYRDNVPCPYFSKRRLWRVDFFPPPPLFLPRQSWNEPYRSRPFFPVPTQGFLLSFLGCLRRRLQRNDIFTFPPSPLVEEGQLKRGFSLPPLPSPADY